MFEKLQPGTGRKDDVKVRMLGKEGTVKVIQNAAINYGARVMEDSAALTKVKAVPGTTGTYRSIGYQSQPGRRRAERRHRDHRSHRNHRRSLIEPEGKNINEIKRHN